MRKIILLLAAVTLFIFSNAESQTLNVASQGQKAVLFNFAGLSNLALNSYDGGTGMTGGIGGKYFISNGLALRGLLLFSVNDQTTKTSPETTNNTFGFGIGAALEYHLPISSHVSPYLGGGLLYATTTNTQKQFTEFKTTTSGFGIAGMAGVEYFFNQNISLTGEYQLGISSRTSSATESVDQSTLQVGFQTATLTLGVYF